VVIVTIIIIVVIINVGHLPFEDFTSVLLSPGEVTL
jgi:hypothetical protein